MIFSQFIYAVGPERSFSPRPKPKLNGPVLQLGKDIFQRLKV
jgi:hypothetical protein